MGVLIDAFPRQCERKQARVARGGLDDVPIPAWLAIGELERPRGLHRAVPHVDRHRHPTRHDRYRMHAQVPADPPMSHARCLEERGCPQRARREDDLSGAYDDLADPWRRFRSRDERATLDAYRAAALDQHLGDPDLGHDAGAGRRGADQMYPDSRLLRPTPATERATATVVAARGVALDGRGLPAEPLGAGEDDLVLWRDTSDRRDGQLVLERGDVEAPRLAVTEFAETVVATPLRPDVSGRLDRRHPVDQRPAPDPGAREHRDRGVPGREEAV